EWIPSGRDVELLERRIGLADCVQVEPVDPPGLHVIGVERDGDAQVGAGLVKFTAERVDMPKHPASPPVTSVEQDGALGQAKRRIESRAAVLDPAEDVVEAIGPTELDKSMHALGIELQGLPCQPPGLGVVFFRVAEMKRLAA